MEQLYSPDHSEKPPQVERAPHLLLVIDDVALLETLAGIAGSDGWKVTAIPELTPLLRDRAPASPDLIVLAEAYEYEDGAEVCSDLRMSECYRHTPMVIATTAYPDASAVAHALLAGADDVVDCRPERLPEFKARLRVQLRHKRYRDTLGRVRAERNGLRADATVDPLTGVLNRRSLDALLEKLDPVDSAICFVDVDHFKKVNDGCGHAAGDEVLRRIAATLQGHIRTHDACARYGGEEFVVVLRGVTAETARLAAERYRRAIARLDFSDDGGPKAVTASIGVALFESPDERVDHVVSRADGALYHAKHTGRNRVVLSPDDMVPEDVSHPPAPLSIPAQAPPRAPSVQPT